MQGPPVDLTKAESSPSETSTDEATATSFVRGEHTDGTADLSVTGDVLFLGGRIAVALRAGSATVFVRADLPAELTAFRTLVENACKADGLQSLDTDSSLAKPLARERLGVETARWDLWGNDLAAVFSALSGRSGGAAPAPVPRESPAPPTAAPASPKVAAPGVGGNGKKVLLALGVVLLVLLGAAIFQTTRAEDKIPTAQPSPSASTAPEAPLVDYSDPAGRFTLKYPETWQVVESTDPDTALLLLGPDGASMLVRLVPLEKPVDPSNVADVKAVTDVIVNGPSVQIVQEQPINIEGAQGYYYLYRFQDQATQQAGVHSHFFLFKGNVLHTLVFQAVPLEAFAKYATDFDRIGQSYRLTT